METSKRIACLDGLKGMCSLAIALCVHWNVVYKGEHLVRTLFPFFSYRGHFFVDLFFMISGFGITLGYERKIQNHEIDFKDFMVRRLSKFYVLHVVTLFLCVLFELIYNHYVGSTIYYDNENSTMIILNLLLLQSGVIGYFESFNAPAWFLSVIILCYIFYYITCFKYKKRLDMIYYLWGGSAVLSIVVIYNDLSFPVLNRFVARGFLGFFIGMVIYRIYCLDIPKVKRLIGLLSMCLFMISYLWMRICSWKYIGNGQIEYSIAVMPALFMAALFFRPLNWFFSTKIISRIGSISIYLYLLHYPCLYGMKALDSAMKLGLDYSSSKLWIIYIFVCLGVSTVTDFFLTNIYVKFQKF